MDNNKYADNPYIDIFKKQKECHQNIGLPTAKSRIDYLKKLKRALTDDFRTDIHEALYNDLRKPEAEAELTEIYQVISEIKFAIKNLKSWMRKQHVDTPLALFGASSYYMYEPKGVCLIMSPWNFPLNLTLGPLVSAIAAGNSVVIKPSEFAPHTAAVMANIIKSVFPDEVVTLIQGDAETAKNLLKLPFNHIYFTGSPAIGKLVMKAASEHLASVTLELGGKSPTIIDASANIKLAAKRIAWGKFMNAGQICVAPDYILVQEAVKNLFVKYLKAEILKLFGDHPTDSNSYCNIISEKHIKRLEHYLKDATEQGAMVETIGNKSSDKTLTPTIISDLTDDCLLMQEEIFGPLLPIKTYQTLDEAIAFINSKPKPLALYMFSHSSKNQKQILQQTSSGTTCINNCVMQYSNHHLPFGGVNNSGIGKGHGFFGYEEFSNKRSVLHQHIRGIGELLYPPYNTKKNRLVKLIVRWF
jgi:aldehyde dehydrogenase (NAD+)